MFFSPLAPCARPDARPPRRPPDPRRSDRPGAVLLRLAQLHARLWLPAVGFGEDGAHGPVQVHGRAPRGRKFLLSRCTEQPTYYVFFLPVPGQVHRLADGGRDGGPGSEGRRSVRHPGLPPRGGRHLHPPKGEAEPGQSPSHHPPAALLEPQE